MLLSRVDRTRLSPVRWHHRLGTFASRRSHAGVGRQLRGDVALCGRRHRCAVDVAGSDVGPLADHQADAAALAGVSLGMVGGRRSRLAA